MGASSSWKPHLSGGVHRRIAWRPEGHTGPNLRNCQDMIANYRPNQPITDQITTLIRRSLNTARVCCCEADKQAVKWRGNQIRFSWFQLTFCGKSPSTAIQKLRLPVQGPISSCKEQLLDLYLLWLDLITILSRISEQVQFHPVRVKGQPMLIIQGQCFV